MVTTSAMSKALGGSHYDEHENDHTAPDHDGLKLEVIPPHPALQLSTGLFELVGLLAQLSRLVHQKFDLVSPVQDFVDRVCHDLLHFLYLALHFTDLVSLRVLVVEFHPLLQDLGEGLVHLVSYGRGNNLGVLVLKALLDVLKEDKGHATLELRRGHGQVNDAMVNNHVENMVIVCVAVFAVARGVELLQNISRDLLEVATLRCVLAENG
mmetsp:Transcript_1684/g.2725  ORF Transcript_1684/g.2725 Transcript_1684/m.2725 type:complete len:210 (-) Transcript_1684:120-749(-)